MRQAGLSSWLFPRGLRVYPWFAPAASSEHRLTVRQALLMGLVIRHAAAVYRRWAEIASQIGVLMLLPDGLVVAVHFTDHHARADNVILAFFNIHVRLQYDALTVDVTI